MPNVYILRVGTGESPDPPVDDGVTDAESASYPISSTPATVTGAAGIVAESADYAISGSPADIIGEDGSAGLPTPLWVESWDYADTADMLGQAHIYEPSQDGDAELATSGFGTGPWPSEYGPQKAYKGVFTRGLSESYASVAVNLPGYGLTYSLREWWARGWLYVAAGWDPTDWKTFFANEQGRSSGTNRSEFKVTLTVGKAQVNNGIWKPASFPAFSMSTGTWYQWDWHRRYDDGDGSAVFQFRFGSTTITNEVGVSIPTDEAASYLGYWNIFRNAHNLSGTGTRSAFHGPIVLWDEDPGDVTY